MTALLPHLERIDLPLGFVIVAAGRKIDYVYFLEDGLGSIVAVSPKGAKAEAGIPLGRTCSNAAGSRV
jgi:CRP-like cAMP-binding protein